MEVHTDNFPSLLDFSFSLRQGCNISPSLTSCPHLTTGSLSDPFFMAQVRENCLFLIACFHFLTSFSLLSPLHAQARLLISFPVQCQWAILFLLLPIAVVNTVDLAMPLEVLLLRTPGHHTRLVPSSSLPPVSSPSPLLALPPPVLDLLLDVRVLQG